MKPPTALLGPFLGRLQSWPWLGTLLTLARRFREDRIALTASSLTFTSVISLVPLATVMLALFSAFPMFSTMQNTLQHYFVNALVPDTIARPVLGAISQFASRASRLGVVGLAALIVSALALMLTMDRALNAIWRVRKPRPIAQRVLVYWSALTLGPLLLAVSIAATSYAITAARYLGDRPRGIGVLFGAGEFIVVLLGTAALFHFVPNTHVRWRHALAGGGFVAVGFALSKRLLAIYFGTVPTYSMIYGAFATVPIFLIWIYLSWIIVLLGAVLAAYAPLARMQISRWPPAAGSRFRLALTMLRALAAERTAGRPGLSDVELSQRLSTDPLQVQPLLDALVEIDWVGRLDEAGDARYVLLCDPQRVSAEPLVGKLLLDPSPDLAVFWREAHFKDMRLAEILPG